MKIKSNYLIPIILLSFVLISGCTDDEETNPKAGTLVLKITDAASDDEDIKGIYITIADIKVNGKPIRHFEPQTVEISSLRDGKTRLLAEKELPAKEYDNITLKLSGNSGTGESTPGCYVLTNDNTRHNLKADGSAETEIEISKKFELLPGKTIKLIADFDLRKAIIRNESNKNRYQFVTSGELPNAIRLFDEENTGSVYGTVHAGRTNNTEIYVLIYEHGEFKASVEGTGSGKSKILFANAVTSARVEPDGSYKIPFLEKGVYDIRIAQFKKNNENQYSFYGFLPTTSRKTGMLLNDIKISPGTETEINIEVFKLL